MIGSKYTFEKKFEILNSVGGKFDLNGIEIEIVGETTSYYACKIGDDKIPTLISKSPLNRLILGELEDNKLHVTEDE